MHPPAETPPAHPPPAHTPADRDQKYRPEDKFLADQRGKIMFSTSTVTVCEDNMDLLESYLRSGGVHGSSDLVERYMFVMMDKSTKEDYRVFKGKLEGEGGEVSSIIDILQCLRGTIKSRRSLFCLRSDYLTAHMHP